MQKTGSRTQDTGIDFDMSARKRWRRREREKTKENEEEKGGRLRVSPPEVGGPRNRLRGLPSVWWFWCVCQTCVSSHLASASSTRADQPVRLNRADGSFASLSPSGPSSRLSSRPISRPSEFTWFASTAARAVTSLDLRIYRWRD